MLLHIEQLCSNKCDWIERCISVIPKGTLQGFSEFETYGTYCLNYYPNQLKRRDFPTFRYGSRIYGIFASTEEIESLSFDLTTVSFEMLDYPVAFERRIRQMLYKYYCKILIKIRNMNVI